MKQTYSISGMTCSGCASTVEKALISTKGVSAVKIDLSQASAEITMQSIVLMSDLQEALKSYPSYRISENGHKLTSISKITGFWEDIKIWKRASFNTLNCLIGCSIGDFGMILFLQYYYPDTSMMVQMILATGAGLITSVALETTLLKVREKFNWKLAFQTALSMSFLSMVAMEIAMNTTDFMITGGKAAFENPMYWIALIVAMIVGFLAPLPYNYYKLKKFNKACH
jgi:copper chaperone CopZ